MRPIKGLRRGQLGELRSRGDRGLRHPDGIAVLRRVDQPAADPAIPAPGRTGRRDPDPVRHTTDHRYLPGRPPPASPRSRTELIVTGIAVGSAQLLIDARSPGSDRETLLTRMVHRVLPPIVTCGCLAVAGGTLVVQAGGGLYWLMPSVLTAIISGWSTPGSCSWRSFADKPPARSSRAKNAHQDRRRTGRAARRGGASATRTLQRCWSLCGRG